MSHYFALFRLFFYLGCVSFGGPTAHLALFQKELIEKRGWLSHAQYVQLVSLCQILPGPTSSQVGMALGFHRAGYIGALVAWFGFTLPAAVVLAGIGMGIAWHEQILQSDFIHGLNIAVVAIVAHAVLTMMKQICSSVWHYVILLVIAGLNVFVLWLPQLALILCAALLGILIFRKQSYQLEMHEYAISKRAGLICWLLFFWGLLILPLILQPHSLGEFFYHFYHAGALVFGGGHVVLPLLEAELSHDIWLSQHQFIAGYGIVQAMPGPLFNFASYLGAAAYAEQPALGAMTAVIGIFLPAALLLFAVLPFVQYIHQINYLKSAFMGMSAGLTGILLAALYQPIMLTAILDIKDVLIAGLAFLLLFFKKMPVWLLVLCCGMAAYI